MPMPLGVVDMTAQAVPYFCQSQSLVNFHPMYYILRWSRTVEQARTLRTKLSALHPEQPDTTRKAGGGVVGTTCISCPALRMTRPHHEPGSWDGDDGGSTDPSASPDCCTLTCDEVLGVRTMSASQISCESFCDELSSSSSTLSQHPSSTGSTMANAPTRMLRLAGRSWAPSG